METQRHLFPGEFPGGSIKVQGEGCSMSVRRLCASYTRWPNSPMCASKHASQRPQTLLPVLLSPQMPCGATPQTLNLAPSPVHLLYPSVWEIRSSTNSDVWPSCVPNRTLGIQGSCQGRTLLVWNYLYPPSQPSPPCSGQVHPNPLRNDGQTGWSGH